LSGELERRQSQTQEYVSRFEPLLYVSAFIAMKDFHYSLILQDHQLYTFPQKLLNPQVFSLDATTPKITNP